MEESHGIVNPKTDHDTEPIVRSCAQSNKDNKENKNKRKCPYCTSTFLSVRQFRKHLQVEHMVGLVWYSIRCVTLHIVLMNFVPFQVEYSCPFINCSKKFQAYDSLANHFRKAHQTSLYNMGYNADGLDFVWRSSGIDIYVVFYRCVWDQEINLWESYAIAVDEFVFSTKSYFHHGMNNCFQTLIWFAILNASNNSCTFRFCNALNCFSKVRISIST